MPAEISAGYPRLAPGNGKIRSAKRWRQEANPCSKRAALWSGRIFPIPKAISAIVTVGNASSASLRTS